MDHRCLLSRLFFCLALATAPLQWGCGRAGTPDTLTIATAANMQFAMQELADSFTADTGIPCNLTLGSSGKLTAQISEGAPFDVFVSADMKYPETLYRAGLGVKPPKVYAYGSLVIWTLNDSITPGLEALTKDGVRHIAIANPETAPYGKAARQALEHYGIYRAVQSKLVFGESIAQTNQFVLSGAAEAGITALAAVRSPQMQGVGRWKPVDPQTHALIAQGALLLKTPSERQDAAQAFYEYLSSVEAAEILKKYGYSIDESIERQN